MAFRDTTGTALRDLLESKGSEGARRVIQKALESGKLRPDDFSIREIWEACERNEDGSVRSIHEAVSSDSFPKITGELINSRIIEAFESAPTIGDELVTTVPGIKQKIDTVAGFTASEGVDEVPEGHPYDDSTLTEKHVTIHNKKYGRIISVTEEMIFFDQTGQILTRAQGIGDKAAQYKERLIVEGVQDVQKAGQYVVYRPEGTGTAIYSTGNGNLKTSNPFGESGLEEVEKLAHQMRDDSTGTHDTDYIFIADDDVIVLVPKDLQIEALQMANSTLVPESAENAVNIFKGKFKVRTSPYITKQSATTWYWGNFKRSFWWEEVWPLQTMSMKPGHEDEFSRDIKSKFKVRMFGGIGAVDYRYAYKSTA